MRIKSLLIALLLATLPIVAPAQTRININQLQQQATNTMLGNFAAGTGNVTAKNIASCTGAGSVLTWVTNTGPTCNSTFLSAPGAIGGGTPSTGAFSSVTLGGGTALANYVEGTCTPTILLGGANTGMTYVTQSCVYTRIGRMVNVIIDVAMNLKGSSTGSVTVGGLPLTANTTANPRPSCAVAFSGLGYVQNQVSALIVPNTTTIALFTTANNANMVAIPDSITIASNTVFVLNCNYYI